MDNALLKSPRERGGYCYTTSHPLMSMMAIVPIITSTICAVYVVLFYSTISKIDTLLNEMNRTEMSIMISGLLKLETCALNILPPG